MPMLPLPLLTIAADAADFRCRHYAMLLIRRFAELRRLLATAAAIDDAAMLRP